MQGRWGAKNSPCNRYYCCILKVCLMTFVSTSWQLPKLGNCQWVNMTFWATINCMQLDHLPPLILYIYTFAIASAFTIYIVIYSFMEHFQFGEQKLLLSQEPIAMSCHKRVPGLLSNCLLTVTIVSKVLQQSYHFKNSPKSLAICRFCSPRYC